MARSLLVAIICAVALGCAGTSPATTAPPISAPPTPVATTAQPTVVAATATPGSKANLPTEVLGTYRDAGETSVVWTFLGAGDPYCLDTVVTETTCMHIERTNFGTIVDYGPVTLVSDGLLELVLLFDEDGACLNFPIQIPFSLDEAGNLTLNTIGTCIEGAPRDQLIRV